MRSREVAGAASACPGVVKLDGARWWSRSGKERRGRDGPVRLVPRVPRARPARGERGAGAREARRRSRGEGVRGEGVGARGLTGVRRVRGSRLGGGRGGPARRRTRRRSAATRPGGGGGLLPRSRSNRGRGGEIFSGGGSVGGGGNVGWTDGIRERSGADLGRPGWPNGQLGRGSAGGLPFPSSFFLFLFCIFFLLFIFCSVLFFLYNSL